MILKLFFFLLESLHQVDNHHLPFTYQQVPKTHPLPQPPRHQAFDAVNIHQDYSDRGSEGKLFRGKVHLVQFMT